jgi:hypothetical protein
VRQESLGFQFFAYQFFVCEDFGVFIAVCTTESKAVITD